MGEYVDISYPIFTNNLSAFSLGPPSRILKYSKESGSSCNCEEIHFIPHAHSTHTETIQHISSSNNFTSSAEIIKEIPFRQKCTVTTFSNLLLPNERIFKESTAVVVKFSLDYPQLNGKPPSFTIEAIEKLFIKYPNTKHLLSNLPSIDDVDEKDLKCHRFFFSKNPRGTITELCDLSQVREGLYELYLSPLIILGGDAHPSRPILKIIE